jgi:hypothetical protein
MHSQAAAEKLNEYIRLHILKNSKTTNSTITFSTDKEKAEKKAVLAEINNTVFASIIKNIHTKIIEDYNI